MCPSSPRVYSSRAAAPSRKRLALAPASSDSAPRQSSPWMSCQACTGIRVSTSSRAVKRSSGRYSSIRVWSASSRCTMFTMSCLLTPSAQLASCSRLTNRERVTPLSIRGTPLSVDSSRGAEFRSLVLGQDLALGKAEKALLVVADLMEVDVGEARVDVALDLFMEARRVGAADDRLGNHVRGDDLHALLEIHRQRQLLAELARQRGVTPDLIRGLLRLLLVLRPADRHLPVRRLACTTGLFEGLDDLFVRRGADQAVADPSSQLGRLWPRGSDVDRRHGLGQGVDARVLDRVVRAVVSLVATLPE